MRMTNSLKALEKTMEKEVLTFFTLLGAGEAPEDWQAVRHAHGQPLPEPESDRKAETTAPHHRPTEASDRSSH